MDMQIVAVPLYDKQMNVDAYLFRYRRGNDLFSINQATSIFDGASRSPVLEALNKVGLDAFSLGKKLFVPVSHITLLNNLGAQCQQPPEKIIFLFEEAFSPDPIYLEKMGELYEQGYRFAVKDLDNPANYDAMLRYVSFFLLSQKDERRVKSEKTLAQLQRQYRHLAPIATHIHSQEAMKALLGKGYALFESRFHRVAVSEGQNQVSPLKVNSIRLLNTVQDENFEFEHVSKIVQGDPALTISLMKMVNAPGGGARNKIKTISHAVAMMGQQEVRKWVTTAVSQSLGNDRPNEITRISLVRAKFAENLAPLFEMAHMSQGLFLMGLFSVLDIILEVPMEEALKMVLVSDMIRSALVERGGLFFPVLNMIEDYESANWSAVSRQMIVHDIQEDALSEAYQDALIWYNNLVSMDLEADAGGKPSA